MDVAVVTGASSSVGLSVARKLVALGLRVYGLDAEFENCPWKDDAFIRVECDLFRQEKVALAWKEVVGRDPHVSILVHAAGAKLEGPLEAAHPDDIRRALEARLMGPALLTRYALPRLIRIRGSVFFINRRGDNAAAAMIEGGIASLCDGLYGEVRDTGVKVCQIALEPNAESGDDPGRHTRLDPDAAALAVESVLRLPAHNSVTRLILRPQATREEPFAAASVPLLRWGPEEVRLPEPENFPPEEELIYTPERKRPADAPPPGEDDDDDFDEEDDELDRLLEESRQRLKNQVERQRQSDRDRQQPRNEGNQPRSDGNRHDGNRNDGNRNDGNQGEGGRKRKRRRGGRSRRGRGRDREQGGQGNEGQQRSEGGQNREGNQGDQGRESNRGNEGRRDHEDQGAREPRSRDADRGSERSRESQFSEPKPESKPKPDSKPEPADKSVSKDKADDAPAPKKKAAKKAAKKAVKKAAKKVAKKAVKKAAKKAEEKPDTPDKTE